ncbi:MAG: M24 family metallopeptidase [Chitinophagaceae bacterium]|nr:MAG: M24 family metallopeptidase [Chitinophagaceae bacterium]
MRILLLLLISISSFAQTTGILPERQRAELIDELLADRFDNLLPKLMEREKIDMWIVISREYNEDPVIKTMLPGDWHAARRRTILVFFNPGNNKPFQKLAISRYNVGSSIKASWDMKKYPEQWDQLIAIINELNPKKIGLNYSTDFGHADGLTYTEHEELVKKLPASQKPKVTSAVDIQRSDSASFDHLRSFSNRPGNLVIMPGDLLHVDIGITYLRFNTDVQQHAYVLLPGETEAPQFLKDALVKANRVQDILTSQFATGKTGNKVLSDALAICKKEGLAATIYTHPLGYHGHAAGPTIGMWDNQGITPGSGDYPVKDNTVYSIELNCASEIPAWKKTIRIMLEEDGYFDGKEFRFISGRQKEFLIF